MSVELPPFSKFFGDANEAEHLQEMPSIPEFFRGRSVFVTGGSGFMGKVLLEKLLRSCPDLGTIYVLLRRKKAVEIEDRLGKILEQPLFDRLRSENPSALTKLVAVAGDVTELGLGMRGQDRTVVQEAVSVVFHTAASVRFDEPVKQALITNVRGTRETLELALGMTKLKVFLHVSTAYSNCDRTIIEEKLYPPHGDWKTMIQLAEDDDKDQILCSLTPKILGNLPNTYTYAKSLTEHLIKDYERIVPVVIFRPSIVTSTFKEPVRGWIDNYNGSCGLMVAGGIGIMRTLYSDPNYMADFVPVDMSIRAIIVAAWHRAVHSRPPTVPVYNNTTMVKPVTQTELVATAKTVNVIHPFRKCLWLPNSTVTAGRASYFVKVLILHMLPALVVDAALMASGRKPMLARLQKRVYVANMSLAYFMFNTLVFENRRCTGLNESLRDDDHEEFRYDQVVTDVVDYMTASAEGGIRYLLHETEEDKPIAQARRTRLYWLHVVTRTCLQLLFVTWTMSFLRPVLAGVINRLS